MRKVTMIDSRILAFREKLGEFHCAALGIFASQCVAEDRFTCLGFVSARCVSY